MKRVKFDTEVNIKHAYILRSYEILFVGQYTEHVRDKKVIRKYEVM